MKQLFLILAILVATITANSQTATSQTPPQSVVDQVNTLFDNGKYTECRELLETNMQYPWSLNRIGNLYYNGNGVVQNYATAVDYYTKAANKGYAQSQFYLGHCYDIGNGVEKDIDLAMAWYKKAATQGHAIAQNFLGDLYYSRFNSDNNADDANKAFYWQEKAAKQDVPQAEYMMGAFYTEGVVVEINDTIALKYFKKTEELGVLEARIWIDEFENPVITPYIPRP